MTPHFSVAEFCRSDTATRLGIDNDLPILLRSNALKTLEMLERIREHLNAPIIITSGFRCLELNTALKSKPTSDHVRACAADIRSPFGSPEKIAQAIVPAIKFLKIGQIVLEYPGPGAWIHVSTEEPIKHINRILTLTRDGYQVGIRNG